MKSLANKGWQDIWRQCKLIKIQVSKEIIQA